MPRLLLFILLFCTDAFGQSADFIAVKKQNGITLRSFTTGSPIVFNTKAGKRTEGYIQQIKNDSIWVLGYRIQVIPTRLGVTMVDTASAYVIKVCYRDIKNIYIQKKARKMPLLISKVLLFGGSGFIVLNSANHVLDGDTELYTRKDNYQRLFRAGAAALAGFTGQLLFRKTGFSRKQHEIVYVDL